MFLDLHFAIFCFEQYFANICRRFTGTSAINQESLPVAHVEFNNSDTRCARVSACHLYAHALRALRACAPCVCPLRAVCVSARFASRLAASSWAHQTRRPLQETPEQVPQNVALGGTTPGSASTQPGQVSAQPGADAALLNSAPIQQPAGTLRVGHNVGPRSSSARLTYGARLRQQQAARASAQLFVRFLLYAKVKDKPGPTQTRGQRQTDTGTNTTSP